jgi:ABC-type multidrug transport system fused ATPase/permease subunit
MSRMILHSCLIFSHVFEQMVLDAGRLVKFDRPAVLLTREGGLLKGMVDESMDG